MGLGLKTHLQSGPKGVLFSPQAEAAGLGLAYSVLLWTNWAGRFRLAGQPAWETKLTQNPCCGRKRGLAELGLGTRLLIKYYERRVR